MEHNFMLLLPVGKISYALVFILLIASGLCSVEENLLTEDIDLIEGDMKLTVDQKLELLAGFRGDTCFKTTKLWPGGVLIFDIDPSIAKDMRAVTAIWRAMGEFERKTCIRFQRRKNEDAYVSLFHGEGCWSYVGKTGSKQLLSLAQNCWFPGTVVHEIAHALGCFHEQSRLDRDYFVTIRWKNIMEAAEDNFNKHALIDSQGTPYDYQSVMHYGPRFFSKNGRPTIVAKKSRVTIGQREGLSTLDAVKINLLYKDTCNSLATASTPSPLSPTATPNDSSSNVIPLSPSRPPTKPTTLPVTTVTRPVPPSPPHSFTPTFPPVPPSPPHSPYPSAPKPSVCGFKAFHGRILGGSEAPRNSWPWQAMLISSGNQFCGGSLVHPLWVITAAHCVQEKSTSSFHVRLGAHYRMSSTNIGTEQDVRVSTIIRHPSYNKPIHLANDIALLKLAEPARLGKGIGLVCLGSSEHDLSFSNKSKCFITGWGTLASGGNQPNVLMRAKVHLVSKERCLGAYHNRIDDSMLCAGIDQGGVDACQGDSGGPLVCEYLPHRWFLEGVTSWGWGCAAAAKFGVYAKVRQFTKWLMDTMKLSSLEKGRPVSTTIPSVSPTSQQASECSHYTNLEDSGRALTSRRRAQSQCDDVLTPGWYRFQGDAGNQMATTCVDINHCGTNAPGWMKGDHPTVAQGASNVQVCFHWAENCCHWYLNIRVRNCSGYYVYELKKPPRCRLRYCGNGETSVSNTTPVPNATTTAPSPRCRISSVASRVIGGVNSQVGQWPWQIALLKGSSKTFSCGGSLIAPDWVVTAAHCISPGQSASFYTIRLGEYNRYLIEGSEQDIPGKRVITHPDYNKPSSFNNDIAMVQLARSASMDTKVGIVCLPSSDEQVSFAAKCYITGWGKISHQGSAHSILQHAEIPPVSNEKCAAKLAESSGGHLLNITSQMLCAGKSGSSVGGCHGDSGGPYVCQKPDNQWVLQGVVSWGSPACSALDRYTVFARVAKFRKWIDSVMNSQK